MSVMLNHSVRVYSLTGYALGFLFEMSEDVHACGVEPGKKRFISLDGPIHEVFSLNYLNKIDDLR